MDTTQIKPIETYYNGYRFRSRLEARWAVFFDAAGIKYQYEPEGYRYTDFDDNEYFYLPDFYLPDFNIWVEVKGNDKALHKDFYKIVNSVDWGRTPMSDGLMILGEIPNPTYFSIPVFPFLYNGTGGSVSVLYLSVYQACQVEKQIDRDIHLCLFDNARSELPVHGSIIISDGDIRYICGTVDHFLFPDGEASVGTYR